MTPDQPSGADPILVALGSDVRTLRLVHAGFRLAREQGRPWIAVHVEVLGWETSEEADQARVWLQEARDLGAQGVWTRSSSVVNGLLAELRKSSSSVLLMGQSRGKSVWGRLEFAKTQELLKKHLGLRIVTIPMEAPSPVDTQPRPTSETLGILAATAVLLVVCAIFASALETLAGFPAIPAVFSAGVAFVTHRWGRRASLTAFLLSIPLYLCLSAGWPRLLYFLGTLSVVLLLVDLVDRLQLETKAGRRREAETVLLMLLGRALARCSTLQEVAEVLSQRIRSLFQADAWLLTPQDGETWSRRPATAGAPACPPPGELLPHFRSASRHRDPLEPLFLDGCSYVPLAGPQGTESLLQIHLPGDAQFPQASWGSLQSFAVQGTLAIERVRFLEAARQAHVDRETERMRSSLLSAISHDLRTPLAAIQGAASSLLLPADPLPESARGDMLAMIRDESQRLARLLSNLLDLTRLESGALQARKEWQPVDEVIGAALRRLETSGSPMEVRVHLQEGLPLVPLDAVLMEQLFSNLLLNAGRHAPGSPIDLRAWIDEGALQLDVSDQGPGIPAAFRKRVFDKFFRLPGAGGDGGVGLGLAICDAVVRTHGGKIWVEDSPLGGASFRIALPVDGAPPTIPQEP